MLENLGNRFQDIFKKIRGHGKLSDSNIKDALREVKMSLLEADVNYKVVKDFTNRISEKAIGTEVIRGVNPAQQFIKLVNDELVELLGGTSSKLTKGLRNPTIIMLAGLQGAGKTTFAAKLAKFLKKQNEKLLLVGVDVYRPAAIKQLQVLGQQIGVDVYSEEDNKDVVGIATRAIEKAKEINADVVTLSGLISPSLKEMERVADLFQKVGMQVPVLIAGAATSKLHTGLKVLPNYDYSLHVTDAMDTITVVSQLLSTKRKDFLETKQNQLRKIAKRYIDNNNETEEKKVFPEVKKTVSYIPKVLGKQFLSLPVEIFKDTLKWDIALYALRVKNTPEEEKTLNDLKKIYEKLIEEKVEFRAAYGYFRCKKTETFLEMEGMTFEVSPNLAQYIEKEDYVGGFVISVGSKIFKDDKYLGLLETLLCNAIAETASEYMETRVSEDIVPTFLRPAVGYPILPDHSLKKVVFDLIDGERTGAKLSPAFAMTPLSTVCGFYLCNDNAKY